jgi:uncharacterized protein
MNELKTVFFTRDMDQVAALIGANDQLFKALNPMDQRQITTELLRHKRFGPILHLGGTQSVIMDLYEMDKLEGSFVETVIANTPYYDQPITRFNAQKLLLELPKGEALEFLASFVSNIENIEEYVGNESLLKMAITKNLPVASLEILLQAGCKANETDAFENGLLHIKIEGRYVEFLVRHGADVNFKNKGGASPLEMAVVFNNLEAVKILLEAGADLNVKNKEGNSMFHLALVDKMCFEVYDTLCEHGCPNFEEPNTEGSILLYEYIRRMDNYSGSASYDYLRKILRQGANIMNCCTYYGQPTTPLDLAISKHFQVFEVVMEHYFDDINSTDGHGNTILHKLCATNLNFESEKAKELYKKVKLVLNKGADTRLRNNNDKLPHELAADDNLKEKIVALLLKP